MLQNVLFIPQYTKIRVLSALSPDLLGTWSAPHHHQIYFPQQHSSIEMD